MGKWIKNTEKSKANWSQEKSTEEGKREKNALNTSSSDFE
jgi:hypothetical protein